MGVDARGFPGGLLRLDPPLRMSSLLPHDLCHGRSASRRPPTVPLHVQKLFSLIQLHLFIFSFIAFAFGVKSKNLSPVNAEELHTCVFFQEFCGFTSQIQVCNLFSVGLCVWCKSVVPFAFYFSHKVIQFSCYLLRRPSFAPLCILGAPVTS